MILLKSTFGGQELGGAATARILHILVSFMGCFCFEENQLSSIRYVRAVHANENKKLTAPSVQKLLKHPPPLDQLEEVTPENQPDFTALDIAAREMKGTSTGFPVCHAEFGADVTSWYLGSIGGLSMEPISTTHSGMRTSCYTPTLPEVLRLALMDPNWLEGPRRPCSVLKGAGIPRGHDRGMRRTRPNSR